MASVDVSPSISFHLFLHPAKILLGSCFSSLVLEDGEGGDDAAEAKDCRPVFGTSCTSCTSCREGRAGDLSWCDSVSGVDPPLGPEQREEGGEK